MKAAQPLGSVNSPFNSLCFVVSRQDPRHSTLYNVLGKIDTSCIRRSKVKILEKVTSVCAA